MSSAQQVVQQYPESVKNRTFLLTGASAGSIAGATAVALAEGKPAQIILVGRTPAKLEVLEKEIHAVNARTKVLTFEVDLSSNASVRAGAAKILADERVEVIDIVITSAHVSSKDHKKSADGIELVFATGHVGQFLLVNLLKSKISAAAGGDGGRVVNVTSAGHRLAVCTPGSVFDPLLETGKVPYNSWLQYGQVKLANILFTRSLVQRGWTSVSIHPGPTNTTMNSASAKSGTSLEETMASVHALVAASPVKPQIVENDMNNPLQPPEMAAGGVLQAALDPNIPNGAYVVYGKPLEPSTQATDDALAQRLWEMSEQLVGEKF
ncbi:hypothetical protein BKA62DRAFT_757782 [Auriculariales sp. MPI-PUGE-AT-0066]|nr:hypothetical protein BKA62DRAFT_757782 [Auriculariales sp. MPI-PUGE-AT-0066]